MVCLPALSLVAQKSAPNSLQVGAPFLMINPDPRTSAVGSAMTGIAPNVNDLLGNSAKIAFAGDWGIGASYSPWLYELNNDNTQSAVAYLSGFKSFNGKEAIGASLRYMSHGTVTFRDDNGQQLSNYKPREFAIDATYARKLGDHYSLGVSLRYIRSDLGEGTYNGIQQKAASAVAGDVGFYYQNYADHIDFGNRYCWGISFSNIGSKLSYSDDDNKKTFLPMNLKIGGGYTFVHTTEHTFTIALDINKLLIPTPPQYELDDQGFPTDVIIKGKDPDRSVVESIFSSFGDAPGGFKEEIKELTFATGVEYAYREQLFIRAGYFYENELKGHRQHASLGAGFRLKPFEINMAYIMPTDGTMYQTRTFKLGLLVNMYAD
ncbi:hypothetical protein COR50_09695 [Chitinophaga caeni]|uniref:Type IX secretion system protein PorV domain-containing protein n=2 Tax=Chitinophaga caeni TaxID=2029983 RepID=A0A291QU27_9BACT|nr:hypothetical protein COR50_09695 [Chitinophaga caeni]